MVATSTTILKSWFSYKLMLISYFITHGKVLVRSSDKTNVYRGSRLCIVNYSTFSFVHYIKTIRDKHNEFTFHIIEKKESSS